MLECFHFFFQMRENGEQFVKTVVSYLQRKLPNIHGPGPLKEEHLNKVNFHADSLAAILVCSPVML